MQLKIQLLSSTCHMSDGHRSWWLLYAAARDETFPRPEKVLLDGAAQTEVAVLRMKAGPPPAHKTSEAPTS